MSMIGAGGDFIMQRYADDLGFVNSDISLRIMN